MLLISVIAFCLCGACATQSPAAAAGNPVVAFVSANHHLCSTADKVVEVYGICISTALAAIHKGRVCSCVLQRLTQQQQSTPASTRYSIVSQVCTAVPQFLSAPSGPSSLASAAAYPVALGRPSWASRVRLAAMHLTSQYYGRNT